jgi:hypothetical protein
MDVLSLISTTPQCRSIQPTVPLRRGFSRIVLDICHLHTSHCDFLADILADTGLMIPEQVVWEEAGTTLTDYEAAAAHRTGNAR